MGVFWAIFDKLWWKNFPPCGALRHSQMNWVRKRGAFATIRKPENRNTCGYRYEDSRADVDVGSHEVRQPSRRLRLIEFCWCHLLSTKGVLNTQCHNTWITFNPLSLECCCPAGLSDNCRYMICGQVLVFLSKSSRKKSVIWNLAHSTYSHTGEFYESSAARVVIMGSWCKASVTSWLRHWWVIQSLVRYLCPARLWVDPFWATHDVLRLIY